MLNFVFLTTLLSTASLNFYNSIGTVFNIPTSKLSTFVFKVFKLVETLSIFLRPSMSTSTFKTIKSFLEVKADVSTNVASPKFF